MGYVVIAIVFLFLFAFRVKHFHWLTGEWKGDKDNEDSQQKNDAYTDVSEYDNH